MLLEFMALLALLALLALGLALGLGVKQATPVQATHWRQCHRSSAASEKEYPQWRG